MNEPAKQAPPPPRRWLGIQGVIALLALGAGGTGVVIWRQDQTRRENELREALEKEEAKRKVVEALLERMTEERVVADVVVIDQQQRDGKMWTQIRLHVKPRPGSATAPTVFGPYTIEGDIVYFEAYVLRFEDEFIHAQDEKRGRALMILTRVFGEHQAPATGFVIEDASGTVPDYYALGQPELAEAEKELWAKFWWYTTHREEAKRDGIEVAHGQAPFTKADPRLIYEIIADNRGNLSVRQKL
jgi:hypothetical protein